MAFWGVDSDASQPLKLSTSQVGALASGLLVCGDSALENRGNQQILPYNDVLRQLASIPVVLSSVVVKTKNLIKRPEISLILKIRVCQYLVQQFQDATRKELIVREFPVIINLDFFLGEAFFADALK